MHRVDPRHVSSGVLVAELCARHGMIMSLLSHDSEPPSYDEPPPTVTFRVVCYGLDPQRVTAATGISPTDISDGEEPFGGQVIPGTRIRIPTGSWALALLPNPDQPLDEELQRLLDQLEPHANALRALPDCRLFVIIDVHVNRTYYDWMYPISKETLGRIHALGAAIILSATCDTCQQDVLSQIPPRFRRKP